ncbi:MAG: DUF4388 domain-containing protein [Deltaproteobacteria bacterium]|nr:DUF4388 domain-containing protein [Deltaproteobacteria bacterium]
MALSGTLSDLGIVDLVQFPGTGKKTGELVIAGLDDEARLFYDQGGLKHVVCGDHSGLDALVELVSWEEGEFEFRLGSTCDEASMEIDLHRALMLALKTRDERREEARKQAEEAQKIAMNHHPPAAPPVAERVTQPPPAMEDLQMTEILSAAVAHFPYIEYAAIFHKNGSKICIWTPETVDEQVYNRIISGVANVFGTHPRKELQKVYLTDNLGTCLGSAVGENYLLFLAAGDDSSLGVISIAAAKICTAISGASE